MTTAELTPFTETERAQWKPPERLTLPEWADKYFFLPGNDPKPGRWRTAFMPHLREPMEAFTDPDVEEIVLETGSQVGKSRIIELCALYTTAEKPTNIIWTLPREKDIKNVAKLRIEETLKACPRVAEEVTDLVHDMSIALMRFRRCSWIWASANSRSDMSQYSCGVALADEFGDWKANLSREGSPLQILRQRTNAFQGRRKIVVASTPNTSTYGIHPELVKTDHRRFHIPCPHCGFYQPLEWAQVKWPKDVPLEKVLADHLGYYECIECEGHWSDLQRREQAQSGVYVPKGASINERGELSNVTPTPHRGYHMPGLLSTLRPFSDFVGRWSKCKTRHDKAAFFRLEIGVPWEERIEQFDAGDLKANVLPGHKLGQFPKEVELVVAAADVGKRAVHWVAWGFARGMTAWLLDRGIEATVAELANVLDKEFGPKKAPARLLWVDTGWDDSTKSTEVPLHKVYEFVHANRGRVHACYGRDNLTEGEVVKTSSKDQIRGKRVAGQFKAHAINVSFFKDQIAEQRTRKAGTVGAFYLPEDCGDDFMEQLSAESKVKDDKGRIRWENTGGPNHYGDATVYAFAAAWHLGFWKGGAAKPEAPESNQREMRPKVEVTPSPDFPFPAKGRRGGWIGGGRRGRR